MMSLALNNWAQSATIGVAFHLNHILSRALEKMIIRIHVFKIKDVVS